MTKLTPDQSATIARAAHAGRPYALWRLPGERAFSLIVSTFEPYQAPVFSEEAAPAFLLAAFDAEDGNIAWHLPADILVTPEGISFLDGTAFTPDPVTEAQRALLAEPQATTVQAAASDIPDPEPTPRAAYEARVSRAVSAIREGQAQKIVLSRIEPRALAPNHDLRALAEALAEARPHAFVTLVSAPMAGTWLTATPEVLLRTDDSGAYTVALAGTQWPEPGTDIAALEWPEKIVEEQGIVAEDIRAAFARAGIGDVRETPARTVEAANLCHLRSDFEAPAATPAQLAELLRILHPTSAVCGMPRPAARDFILAEEGQSRGFYTGYIGPSCIAGETRLQVNLRAARLTPTHAFLHVGGGIVAASDPALEYEETVEKTRTVGVVF